MIPGFLQQKTETLGLQSAEEAVWMRIGRKQRGGERREQSNFPRSQKKMDNLHGK